MTLFLSSVVFGKPIYALNTGSALRLYQGEGMGIFLSPSLHSFLLPSSLLALLPPSLLPGPLIRKGGVQELSGSLLLPLNAGEMLGMLLLGTGRRKVPQPSATLLCF